MTPKPCPDCGNAPVYHWAEKSTAYLDIFFNPLIFPLRAIWQFIEPWANPLLENIILPKLFKGLAVVGLGKIISAPDKVTNHRALVFWREANNRRIKMWEFRPFGKSFEFFVAEYENKTIGFESLPRPGRTEPHSLLWVDNKKILRKKFLAESIPMAKGGSALTLKKAREIFKEINGTVIVKPHHGSRSRHTTTHIYDLETFEKAFWKAKKLSPSVLIEEELKGMVHRITLVDGKVVGVLRREPPSIVADGVHTIQELIEMENKNPLRDGDIFHALTVDQWTSEELKRQEYSLASVPPKDTFVFLHQKASRGIGGGATDMTDIIHSDNIALFEKVARILADPLVGIDFITSDIRKSWKDTDGDGIIECNGMPFIDIHHYPLAGRARDVAGALWDIVMPETNLKSVAISSKYSKPIRVLK